MPNVSAFISVFKRVRFLKNLNIRKRELSLNYCLEELCFGIICYIFTVLVGKKSLFKTGGYFFCVGNMAGIPCLVCLGNRTSKRVKFPEKY